MHDVPEIAAAVSLIGQEAFDNLIKLQKTIEKENNKTVKQYGEVTEVYEKYGSLSGYRMTIVTEKKGKITQVFKIGGRISKNDAKLLAETELERMKRKYKVA